MDHLSNEFLWVEKHRPKTIRETILPENIKNVFQKFVDQKNVPNLILSGTAGVGKTTVARAMLEELGADYIIINGSMNGNIDTLRNEILRFVSTVSLYGGRKYVILDEADYLNANSTQPALRNFMEEFSKNASFILTCNFPNKIIEPLHSRCSVINFKISKKDAPALAKQFLVRTKKILEAEGVDYDAKVLAELIMKFYPDWRRTLNELQMFSSLGRIDESILTNMAKTSIKDVIDHMKKKNFTEVRKWVKNNIDTDVNDLFNQFYENSSEYFTSQTVPLVAMLTAKYQYQNAFVANPEINFLAYLTEVMIEAEFV